MIKSLKVRVRYNGGFCADILFIGKAQYGRTHPSLPWTKFGENGFSTITEAQHYLRNLRKIRFKNPGVQFVTSAVI